MLIVVSGLSLSLSLLVPGFPLLHLTSRSKESQALAVIPINMALHLRATLPFSIATPSSVPTSILSVLIGRVVCMARQAWLARDLVLSLLAAGLV